MRMLHMLRAMDAYIGNDSGNDGDVICAGCGYAIPDDELAARYGEMDVYPADALCAGCAVDEQDSPYDCPQDAMWK